MKFVIINIFCSLMCVNSYFRNSIFLLEDSFMVMGYLTSQTKTLEIASKCSCNNSTNTFVLWYTVMYNIIPCHTILYCIVLYSAVFGCIVFYCSILCWDVIYCAVLCYTQYFALIFTLRYKVTSYCYKGITRPHLTARQ